MLSRFVIAFLPRNSCVWLCNPMVCPWNSPGKNTGVGCHSFSRGSSQPRDWTQVSCIAGRFFTIWSTKEFCLQSLSAVILEHKKIKSATICHEVKGPDGIILVFWMLLWARFSLSSFTLIKRFFCYSRLCAIRVESSAYVLCIDINKPGDTTYSLEALLSKFWITLLSHVHF